MFKDSFYKSSYKPKSFLGDFKKEKDEEKKYSFTLPAYVKPMSSDGAVVPKTDSVAPSTGSQIKTRLKSVLSKKYGGLDTKNLFDDIDDKDVENNISTAESAIKANIDKGFLNTDYFKKFPNLRDGLALSYAAADKGNSKEAKKAREAAYTEDEPLVKETGDRMLYNDSVKTDFPNRTNNSSSNARFLAETRNNNSKQGKAGKRYVRVESGNLNMRSLPGTNNSILDKMPRGTEVNFTGNKTTVGNEQWAEIEYGGQKGWVDANYLKIDKPVDISKSFTSSYQNTEKTTTHINPNKYKSLQDSFDKVGDFDGFYGVQCPDLVKWFISTQTTLSPENGNGCLQTQKIASQKEDLVKTNIPCAPAVFSVKEGTYGPGIKSGGVSDEKAGHTGIVLSCKKLDNGNYSLTNIHTYNGLNDNGHISTIKTEEFSPSDNVTYVNIGKYIK